MEAVVLESSLETQQEEFAASFNLSLKQYKLVVKSCTFDEVVVVLELMKYKTHRSMYRQLMAGKVRRWLDLGVVSKPFTPREFKTLTPTWRVTWKLPT
jgi:hypothetical protein